jgi:hypothetical protein
MRKYCLIWVGSLIALIFAYSCKKNFQSSIHVSQTNPASDRPGATIEIEGAGFGQSQQSTAVYFNGVKASILSINDSVITVIIPAGATTGTLTVVANGSNYQSPMAFVITTGRWVQKANFHGPPVSEAMGFSIGNLGYVCGGAIPLQSGGYNFLYCYDPTQMSAHKRRVFLGWPDGKQLAL